MKKRIATILFLASYLSSPAHASASPSMDQLLSMSMHKLMSLKVRISTDTDEALSKAPSVVSVFTESDIEATGATDLTDLLQSVPGIYVRENLFGFRPIVTFRGASGNQTLLMLNGEPMSDLVWTSGIYWKGLPTSIIKRIEIIRGPGSALYGAGASAGVINVITKTAGVIRDTEAGMRVGSFGTQEGWAQSGGTWHGFEVGVTAGVWPNHGFLPYIAQEGRTLPGWGDGRHVCPGRCALRLGRPEPRRLRRQ